MLLFISSSVGVVCCFAAQFVIYAKVYYFLISGQLLTSNLSSREYVESKSFLDVNMTIPTHSGCHKGITTGVTCGANLSMDIVTLVLFGLNQLEAKLMVACFWNYRHVHTLYKFNVLPYASTLLQRPRIYYKLI